MQPGETIYRQFSKRLDLPQKPWFESGTPPVPPAFFNPSPNDFDGLSVIRAVQRHRRWAGRRYRPEEPNNGLDEAFKLGCLFADDVSNAGMNVKLSRDEFDARHETNAHAVILELSIEHKTGQRGEEAKKQFISFRNKLRFDLCNQIIGPFDLPDDSTPILPED